MCLQKNETPSIALHLFQTFPVKNNEFVSLLQSVVSHWQLSAKAYVEYMENGKKFRYAEMLKVHNTAVKKLLTDNMYILPENLKEDAGALIEHYTIWSGKWDDLKNKLNPAPDDEFVFENDHRFPRTAAQNLETVLKDLSADDSIGQNSPK